MVSTCSVSQWPNIPKEELLEAMREKSVKVARSDKPQDATPGAFVVPAEGVIEAVIPSGNPPIK